MVEALCIPIMVESTLAGFIYLDNPEDQRGHDQSDADVGAFPLGLARLAALGMANLMRIDIALRQERMDAELRAAAEAQRWLLPHREGRCGPFTYAGETRQGRQIGGDFFDIIPLDSDRIAVVFGDVGGRGIPVSVLVSASQGFLHACMLEHGKPGLAAASVDRLYTSRISHSRFLKLWVGVFDARKQSLCYLDAGHGAVVTVFPDGRCNLLAGAKNPPIGTKDNVDYKEDTIGLSPGTRLLVLSDGFVEQRAKPADDDTQDQLPPNSSGDRHSVFGISRVQETLQGLSTGGDEITALFDALHRHAGTTFFADDATAVIIRS